MIPHPDKAYKGGEDAFFISPKKDMFGEYLCSPLYLSIPSRLAPPSPPMHCQAPDYASFAPLCSHAFQSAAETALVAIWASLTQRVLNMLLAYNAILTAPQSII